MWPRASGQAVLMTSRFRDTSCTLLFDQVVPDCRKVCGLSITLSGGKILTPKGVKTAVGITSVLRRYRGWNTGVAFSGGQSCQKR